MDQIEKQKIQEILTKMRDNLVSTHMEALFNKINHECDSIENKLLISIRLNSWYANTLLLQLSGDLPYSVKYPDFNAPCCIKEPSLIDSLDQETIDRLQKKHCLKEAKEALKDYINKVKDEDACTPT